jgi:corrinoid protein of di/trimethylamine methyltransferase
MTKILEDLAKAVVEGNAELGKKLAEEAINIGIDAYEAIHHGCTKGMEVVSDKYERGEMYVPEILLSADAMQAAIDVLKPHLRVEAVMNPGTIVIGVVEGDIHDIGKNLTKIMLEIAGFKVYDLGSNVSPEDFVNKAIEVNADIVGISTLMTTTMPIIQKVIQTFKTKKIRDKVKIIIGGAPTSKDFADAIGADGWAENAVVGVKKIEELIEELRQGPKK